MEGVPPDRGKEMRSRKEASREHGFQDEIPESGRSSERQRFAEQVGMLVRALRSAEESVQELAVVQISLLGPKAVPYLTSALEDALEESDMRQSAQESMSGAERAIAGICGALGIIRDFQAVIDLAEALPRKEAVEALSKIGGDRALNLIMDTIEDEPGLGGPLRSYGGHAPWLSGTVDADPAFVRRVFLRFGEVGKKRLEEELANESGSRRAAIEEIIRIMGYSGGLE